MRIRATSHRKLLISTNSHNRNRNSTNSNNNDDGDDDMTSASTSPELDSYPRHYPATSNNGTTWLNQRRKRYDSSGFNFLTSVNGTRMNGEKKSPSKRCLVRTPNRYRDSYQKYGSTPRSTTSSMAVHPNRQPSGTTPKCTWNVSNLNILFDSASVNNHCSNSSGTTTEPSTSRVQDSDESSGTTNGIESDRKPEHLEFLIRSEFLNTLYQTKRDLIQDIIGSTRARNRNLFGWTVVVEKLWLITRYFSEFCICIFTILKSGVLWVWYRLQESQQRPHDYLICNNCIQNERIRAILKNELDLATRDQRNSLEKVIQDLDLIQDQNKELRTEIRLLKDTITYGNSNNISTTTILSGNPQLVPPPPPPPPPPLPSTTFLATTKPNPLKITKKNRNNSSNNRPVITLDEILNVKLRKTMNRPSPYSRPSTGSDTSSTTSILSQKKLLRRTKAPSVNSTLTLTSPVLNNGCESSVSPSSITSATTLVTPVNLDDTTSQMTLLTPSLSRLSTA